MFHTIVRIILSKSGETSSEDRVGVGSSPFRVFTQSFPQLSHLDVTQISGTMRPPSPLHSGYGPQLGILTWFGPFLLLLTDQFSYLYLRLYSICVNWAIHTTFRIGPPKEDGTSSEAQTARVRIPSRSRPILPAAIPSRRFPNHPEQWRFPPTTLREDPQGGSWTWYGSLPLCSIRNSYSSYPLSFSFYLMHDLPTIHTHQQFKRESRNEKVKVVLLE